MRSGATIEYVLSLKMGETHSASEPFPWELGVFDAHCHPTDTMASISSIAEAMRARTLTVMATRSQDQELVAKAAESYGVSSQEAITSTRACANGMDAGSAPNPQKVVPSFGWHPWFSHQLFDDVSGEDATFDPASLDQEAEKRRHYNAVLVPSPQSKEDEEFIRYLPTPQPLSAFIAQTRHYLEAYPFALVGEIGLDRAFRLPNHEPAPDDLDNGMTPGRRDGRTLSPYRVHVDHQARILKAQLNLAGEMGRAVSVHGVQAPGNLYDALRATWEGHEKRVTSNRERKRLAVGVDEDFSDSDSDPEDNGEHRSDAAAVNKRKHKSKPYPPRICLHSFSGSVQTLKQYAEGKTIPAKIFFSFSLLVNYSTGAHQHDRRKHIADEVIRACPDDRVLLESDLHCAGPEMDDLLEEIYRKVCQVKGWSLREGVDKIKRNYEEFILG